MSKTEVRKTKLRYCIIYSKMKDALELKIEMQVKSDNKGLNCLSIRSF